MLIGGEEGDQPESKATNGLCEPQAVKTEEIKTDPAKTQGAETKLLGMLGLILADLEALRRRAALGSGEGLGARENRRQGGAGPKPQVPPGCSFVS